MQLSPQVFSHLVKLLTYPLEEDVLTKQEKNTIKRDIYIYINSQLENQKHYSSCYKWQPNFTPMPPARAFRF